MEQARKVYPHPFNMTLKEALLSKIYHHDAYTVCCALLSMKNG
jgi:hypothetical protein